MTAFDTFFNWLLAGLYSVFQTLLSLSLSLDPMQAYIAALPGYLSNNIAAAFTSEFFPLAMFGTVFSALLVAVPFQVGLKIFINWVKGGADS